MDLRNLYMNDTFFQYGQDWTVKIIFIFHLIQNFIDFDEISLKRWKFKFECKFD